MQVMDHPDDGTRKRDEGRPRGGKADSRNPGRILRLARNRLPDLKSIASATECTGILPAQQPGEEPDELPED